MNKMHLVMLLLIAAYTGSSEAEESAENGQNVRYEGPVVYSDLPPPVLYFPSMPHPDRNLRQNDFQSRMHQASITKNAIEYVPFPYQDLPVLVYQSKENPPIHIVSNLQNGDKSSEESKKTTNSKEMLGSGVTGSIGQKGTGKDLYQEAIGNAGITLNTGLEYQHVVIQLPQDIPGETYSFQRDNQEQAYNSNIPYSPSENGLYYETPYENDVKGEYGKISQQTYSARQSPDNFPQESQAYQTVAVIDYSQLMSSAAEHDSSGAGTGRTHESSPERTGYFWRQSNLPTLRQYFHMTNPFHEGPQTPRPTSSDTRFYHTMAPVNPFAAFYDVSTRLVNPSNENLHTQKQNSMFSVSPSDAQPLYAPPPQHGAQVNMMKNHPDSSTIVYHTSPSTVQHLYIQMPPESDNSNRETKHVDNHPSPSSDSYKQQNNQNQHHSSSPQEVSDNTKNNAKAPSYNVMSSQSQNKYSDSTADPPTLPHLLYTGHPPIHVFQHPIVIKVSDKEGENHLRGTQSSYGATGNEMKIPIGSVGNFGLFKPTFQKSSLDSPSNLEQSNNNGDIGTQNVRHQETVKNTGNLAEIFRQQADSYLGNHNYGRPEQGQLQAIALPIDFDSIAIYGGKFSPFGNINRGYYNRFLIGNKSPAASQGTNAAVLASRLFGRLAALGNTFFVNNLGLKPNYYHRPISPQVQTTLTELVSAHPATKLENLHYTNPSTNRDSNLNSKLSERMSAIHASNSIQSARTADSSPKVQYKTPPTKTTAAPQHHKPPIIIYKGIQPPVHVYGNEGSIEKTDSEERQKSSYETEYKHVKNSELKDVQEGSLPITQAGGLQLPQASRHLYNPQNYAPQTYSIPYDYRASTFSNRASVDHEEFDNSEETYHPAMDYPKEKSDLSWMPINFPHYTEAESIGDLTVPSESGESMEENSEGGGTQSLQPPSQNDPSDTLQPKVDDAPNAEESVGNQK